MSGAGNGDVPRSDDQKSNVVDPSQSNPITIKVKSQDGNEVFFKIKRNTQLRKLMTAYCSRQSIDINAIVFLFDGQRIKPEHTPDQLGMEEGDEVDAMLHQTGGGIVDE